MTIFEQYTAAIPLFFPSPQYLEKLHGEHFGEGVLSELSFNQVEGRPPGSVIACDDRDPNNYSDSSTMMPWIMLSDYYDTEMMPAIQFFDTADHLYHILKSSNYRSISEEMKFANIRRKQLAYTAWQKIIEQVSQANG